jgi:hypothetical protein
MQDFRPILDSFTLQTLPDLDEVTLGALQLLMDTPLPQVDFHQFSRPLVVGSGNAAVTGKLLFDDVDAVFADESSYLQKLSTIPAIDGAFLLSASGGKHALEIAQMLRQKAIPTILLTNNQHAPALEFIPETSAFVFPKNREPYTYNTSTYMGMILSKTHEDPEAILHFIETVVTPRVPDNFATYGAFYFLVPEAHNSVREMFQTKFDELFGPRVKGRIFTTEQTKHAKTVIPLDSELFISFGVENSFFGAQKNRLHIPLPEDAGYAAMMAIGYFVIGHIQKQLPPFYKNRIEAYAQETSEAFGSTINPIVE